MVVIEPLNTPTTSEGNAPEPAAFMDAGIFAKTLKFEVVVPNHSEGSAKLCVHADNVQNALCR